MENVMFLLINYQTQLYTFSYLFGYHCMQQKFCISIKKNGKIIQSFFYNG